MAKVINCRAGEWTKLVSNFGSGFPKTFEVTLAGDAPITGEWLEKRAWWIFPQSPKRGPLTERLSFHRNWINAIYSIAIRPDRDVVATIR